MLMDPVASRMLPTVMVPAATELRGGSAKEPTMKAVSATHSNHRHVGFWGILPIPPASTAPHPVIAAVCRCGTPIVGTPPKRRSRARCGGLIHGHALLRDGRPRRRRLVDRSRCEQAAHIVPLSRASM